MVIAVEGMDGVGKTEVSKFIADEFGFKFIEKPLHFFYDDGEENNYADLMRAANKMYDVQDTMIKSWYFSLGNIYASRYFKDEDVVIDRHLVSNYYWNGDIESEPIFRTLIDVAGCPDMTILLHASPSTRMKRLQMRDPEDPDLYDDDKKDDGFKKMLYFVEKFGLPYTLIDTENCSLEEVKEQVATMIKSLKVKEKVLARK